MKHGEYTWRGSGGAVEQGYLVNGLREGPFIYSHTEGSVTRGIFKNDKFEGRQTTHYPDGTEFESFWVNGVLEENNVIKY